MLLHMLSLSGYGCRMCARLGIGPQVRIVYDSFRFVDPVVGFRKQTLFAVLVNATSVAALRLLYLA